MNLYADDTSMFYGRRSEVSLLLTLTIELTTICEWLKANRLMINVSKTKFNVFGMGPKLSNFSNYEHGIDGSIIERVSIMKYLGMILDDCLNFNKHMDYLHKNVPLN